MRAIAKQRIARFSYVSSIWKGSSSDEARFLDSATSLLGKDVHCIPIGRARTGIHLLVKHSITERRKKVLLSPYTIADVVNMVALAGATPVFVDFKERSTNLDVDQLSDLLTDDVACVLVTHHHVNQAQLTDIRTLCASRGVPLFDDCAIAFGGNIGGKPIGTLTDASVFSFSVYKVLNYFWGGLITTRDGRLAQAIEREVAGWKRLSYVDYVASSKNATVYDVATRPLVFNTFTFPRLQRRAKASAQSVELTYPRIEHKFLDATLTSRPSHAAFAEWRRKLESVAAQIAHRREMAAIYRAGFRDTMVSAESSDAILDGSCFVNFPIAVDRGSRDELHRQAMLAGYDLGKSLYPNVHEHDAFKQCAGYSDHVRDLVRSSLYFPTHFGVSASYASALSKAMSDIIGRHGAADRAMARTLTVLPDDEQGRIRA